MGDITKNPLTLIDLFAGCGGLSLGLEEAGFTSVFVNELNHDAMATYLANRNHSLGGSLFSDNSRLQSHDAHELTGKRLQQLRSDLSVIGEFDLRFPSAKSKVEQEGSTLDLIAGGPPCQGYSGIGHRRSYSVDKTDVPSNHLYVRMARIIDELKPRMFLFENVKGLLSSRWSGKGSNLIWPDVLAEFRNIPNYEVRWSLVKAKDYGVPQNRPRVLMVGIRKDLVSDSDLIDASADPEDAITCQFLPDPIGFEPPHLEDLLGDLIDPSVDEALRTGDFPSGRFATLDYLSAPKSLIQKKLRASNPSGLTEQEYSKHKPHVVEKFSTMISNDGLIPEHMKTKKFYQRLLPAKWDHRGPTITATSLPDDYVHYSQPRILTVREWARLQLFPDRYQFRGKRTTGGIRRAGNPRLGVFERELPKYTQIGNAVPVGLAEAIGKHFRNILSETYK